MFFDGGVIVVEVDVPPDIIDVVDEDVDIIDDEYALPHDLADSDDEDLINVDDDEVERCCTVLGGDSDGEDRPPQHYVPTGCRVASLTEVKANESPIWAAGQRA
nr:hypothetical protein [Tanacetum cinerariifolium]